MSVTNGQPVNSTYTNPAFLKPDVDDFTVSKLGMQCPTSPAGYFVQSIQRYINNLAQVVGLNYTGNYTAEADSTGNTYGSSSSIVSNGTTFKNALTAIMNAFGSSGHGHTGSGADGAQISLSTAVTGTLGISNGGTGGTTATVAITNISPQTTKGDIIAYSTLPIRLAAGSNGNVLTADSTASSGLSWAPASTITALNVVSKTANYTVTSTDDVILCDSSGGTFTITMLTAVGRTGKTYTIKKTDSSLTAVTINTTSSQTIDGALTQQLSTQYEDFSLFSDGTNWQIQNRRIPGTLPTFTPTYAGLGTPTSISTLATRSGSKLKVSGSFIIGTPSATAFAIIFPSGYVIDTTNLAGVNLNKVGFLERIKTGAGYASANFGSWPITVDPANTDRVALSPSSGSTAFTDELGNNVFTASDRVSYNFEVPISGWGS